MGVHTGKRKRSKNSSGAFQYEAAFEQVSTDPFGDGDDDSYWDNDAFADPVAHLDDQLAKLSFCGNRGELDELERQLEALSPFTDSQKKKPWIRKISVEDPDFKVIDKLDALGAPTGERWLRDTNRNLLLGKVKGETEAGNYDYEDVSRNSFPWTRRILDRSQYSKYRVKNDAPVDVSKRADLFIYAETYGVDDSDGIKPEERLVTYLFALDHLDRTATIVVRGKNPHFYVKVPASWPRHDAARLRACINSFRTRLNSALSSRVWDSFYLRKQMGKIADDRRYKPLVLDVELITRGRDLHICRGKDHFDDFLKITLPHPKLLPVAKTLLKHPSGGVDGSWTIPPWYLDRNSQRDAADPSVIYPESGEPAPDPRFMIEEHYRGFMCYESNVAYTQRTRLDRRLEASNWVCIDGYRYQEVPDERRYTSSQLEYECLVTAIRPAIDQDMDPVNPTQKLTDRLPDLTVGGFDIEAEPNAEGGFPGPVNERVIQIAYHSYSLVSRQHKRYLFMLGSINEELLDDPDKEVGTVFCFETEEKLLSEFCIFVQVMQHQFLMGWNSNGFDIPFIANRCLVLGVPFAQNLGVMPSRRMYWTNSRNKGREKTNVTISGVITYDLMYHIMGMKQYKSAKLSFVCSEILKENKNEQSYQVIRAYQKTVEGRTRLAAYCAQDVNVLIELLKKLSTILSLVEESRTTNTMMGDLLDRASLHKLFMTTLTYARDLSPGLFQGAQGFYPHLVPVAKPEGDAYVGGAVLKPTRGYYKDDPVYVPDVMSLYPSEVRENNLGNATALPEWVIEKEGLVEGVDYRRAPKFTVQEELPGHVTEDRENNNNVAFATKSYQRGLMPAVENSLHTGRRATKKLMNAALDEYNRLKDDPDAPPGAAADAHFRFQQYNAKQQSQKVVMNSIYGARGSYLSKERMKPMAEAICTHGRFCTVTARYWGNTEITPENGYPFVGECIYGDTDSVMIVCRFPKRKLYDPIKGRVVETQIPLQEKGAILFSYVPQLEDHLNRFTNERCRYKEGLVIWESEKLYFHYLLEKAKMYCGLLVSTDGREQYVDIKGLKAKRRDCSGFMLRVQKSVINALCVDADVDKAIEIVRQAIQDLRDHKVSYEELRKSMSLSKYPEEYTVVTPHVAVALLNQERTGKRARPGDRINYIITKSLKFLPGKKVPIKKREVAEDALYAIENGLDYDEESYIQGDLMNNTINLLQHCVPGGAAELKRTLYAKPKDQYGGSVLENTVDALKSARSAMEEEDLDRETKKRKLAAIDKKINSIEKDTMDKHVSKVTTARCRNRNCRKVLSRSELKRINCLHYIDQPQDGVTTKFLYCATCIKAGVAREAHGVPKKELEIHLETHANARKPCETCVYQTGSRTDREIDESIRKCMATDCTWFWQRKEARARAHKARVRMNRFAPEVLSNNLEW